MVVHLFQWRETMTTTKIKGSNKRTRGSIRAKAGLPAKAGKRKAYGPGITRKTKDWSALGKGFQMTHDSPEIVVTPEMVSDTLEYISGLKFHNTTDMFARDRMVAHAKAGILTKEDLMPRKK